MSARLPLSETAYLLYHTSQSLSILFLNFFQKNFFQKKQNSERVNYYSTPSFVCQGFFLKIFIFFEKRIVIGRIRINQTKNSQEIPISIHQQSTDDRIKTDGFRPTANIPDFLFRKVL